MSKICIGTCRQYDYEIPCFWLLEYEHEFIIKNTSILGPMYALEANYNKPSIVLLSNIICEIDENNLVLDIYMETNMK